MNSPAHEDSCSHNLGDRHEPFFGRESELAFVSKLLANHRLVTIVGEPGIGKSCLACMAGLGELDRFTLGLRRLFVRSGTDETGLLAELANECSATALSESQAIPFLQDRFQNASCLVILDQCDRAHGAVAAAVEWLLAECPLLSVLATCRLPLDIESEAVAQLGPLEGPHMRAEWELDEARHLPAVRLFVDRVEQIRNGEAISEEELVLATRICAELRGHPAAIRLAASTSALQGIDVIDEAIRLSSGSDASLYESVERSLASLDPALQRLASRLTVLCHDWAPSAALAVSGLSDPEACERALSDLSDAGLLEFVFAPSGAIRYRLPDPVLAFLASRPSDIDRLEAEEAHFEHYREKFRSWAETGDINEALAGMAAEYPNARLAAERALSARDAKVLRLIGPMSLFWQRMRPHSEGRAISLAAAELVDDNQPSVDSARTLNVAATYGVMTGSNLEALPFALRAYEISKAVDDTLGMAMAQSNIALIQKNLNDFDAARTAASKAVDLMRSAGDIRRLIACLNNYASILEDMQEYEPAEVHFLEAVALADRQGDLWLALHPLSGIAEMHLHCGRAEDAKDKYRECLERAAKVSDHTTMALSAEGAAFASIQLGRFEAATMVLSIAQRFREERELAPMPLQEEFIREAWKDLEGALGKEKVEAIRRTAEEFAIDDALDFLDSTSEE